MLQITIVAVTIIAIVYINVLHSLIRGLQKTVNELHKQIKILKLRLR